MKRISTFDTVLIVIDMQEKLLSAMSEKEEIIENVIKVISGFNELKIPIIFTQQYTKGLGMTAEKLQEAYMLGAEDFSFIEKKSFSIVGEESFINEIKRIEGEIAKRERGLKNIVICGIEAHICVLQSALDMQNKGYNVFILADAISSRKDVDKKYTMDRLIQAGIVPATVESLLFELILSAEHESFRNISKIIK